MSFETLLLAIGLLLILVALTGTLLKRMPLSSSIIYLAAGLLFGPAALDRWRIDPIGDASLLERMTELVVLVSLFTAGLKLRAPLRDRQWRLPLRLAFVSMSLTVALIAAVGHWLLGLSLGGAVLLGAVLAPTDPVLASDVQVRHENDRETIRFGLTGEAGLNDGTAFPFVMLGLGLLGVHELGVGWSRWLTVDVFWAITAGLIGGWLLGSAVARLTKYLRSRYQETESLDGFLALGLLLTTAGLAHLMSAYAFLAVFAAALALLRAELPSPEGEEGVELPAPDSGSDALEGGGAEGPPPQLARAVLGFSEHLERVSELAMVVLLGAMFASGDYLPLEALWFVPLLLLGLRPAAVLGGLLGVRLTRWQRGLICWFGIRGIGSLYYLAFALHHGLEGKEATTVTGLVLVTVAASIIVHGVSATPLMNRYYRDEREPG